MKQQFHHTPGPWRSNATNDHGRHVVLSTTGNRKAICVMRNTHEPDWIANSYLIAAAPMLLTALEEAFVILDRISDTLHYEDGLPVTALESRDIEIIYGDAITELARFETLIREARGQS